MQPTRLLREWKILFLLFCVLIRLYKVSVWHLHSSLSLREQLFISSRLHTGNSSSSNWGRKQKELVLIFTEFFLDLRIITCLISHINKNIFPFGNLGRFYWKELHINYFAFCLCSRLVQPPSLKFIHFVILMKCYFLNFRTTWSLT